MYLKSIFIALFTTLLVACGGGGSGESGGTITPPLPSKTITGQVVKGPVEGATVNLYLLSDTGSKSLVATAKSVANGKFDFTVSLTSGRVYLLESSGGTYTDEVSKQATTLAYPLRAIFIAPSAPAKVTINPLSELVLMDIDKSILSDKWLASNVSSSLSKVALALGVDSTTGANYIDLANLNEAVAETATEPDLAFSFQINLFSGVVNEIKKRNSNATFKDAFKTYYSMTQETNNDDSIASIFAASLIRAVDSIPVFSTTGARGEILNAAGLPADANLSVFEGAESTGNSIEKIPNDRLKLLPLESQWYKSGRTKFNDRGALIAYPDTNYDYSIPSNIKYKYIGFGSVSDVYGNKNIAIGKWKSGYYYDMGISESQVLTGVVENLTPKTIESNKSYLAYYPALNLPECGIQTMSLTSATKGSVLPNETSLLSLQPNSKVAFLHMGETSENYSNSSITKPKTIFLGYELYFIDSRGKSIIMKSTGGVERPTVEIDQSLDKTFSGQFNDFTLNFNFKAVLAGEGGENAGFVFSTGSSNDPNLNIAAVFSSDKVFQKCPVLSFKTKGFSPVALSNESKTYSLSYNENSYDLLNINSFQSDGTPSFLLSNFNSNGIYEKSGNQYVGIGIYNPPYNFRYTELYPRPKVFAYLDISPSLDQNLNDNLEMIRNYRLISTTPYLSAYKTTLYSVEDRIKNGFLKITMHNLTSGTCQLSLNDGTILINSTYFSLSNGGYCTSSFGNNEVNLYITKGGVSNTNTNFAVIHLISNIYLSTEEVGLVFEKVK